MLVSVIAAPCETETPAPHAEKEKMFIYQPQGPLSSPGSQAARHCGPVMINTTPCLFKKKKKGPNYSKYISKGFPRLISRVGFL